MKVIEKLLEKYSELPAFVGKKNLGINTKGNFGEYPLHIAVIQGNLDDVKILIQNGANINAKGEHGYTALHEAIERQNLEILNYLISAGADFNIQNDDGFTFQDLAIDLDIEL